VERNRVLASTIDKEGGGNGDGKKSAMGIGGERKVQITTYDEPCTTTVRPRISLRLFFVITPYVWWTLFSDDEGKRPIETDVRSIPMVLWRPKLPVHRFLAAVDAAQSPRPFQSTARLWNPLIIEHRAPPTSHLGRGADHRVPVAGPIKGHKKA
jgi:hypothetical protein